MGRDSMGQAQLEVDDFELIATPLVRRARDRRGSLFAVMFFGVMEVTDCGSQGCETTTYSVVIDDVESSFASLRCCMEKAL